MARTPKAIEREEKERIKELMREAKRKRVELHFAKSLKTHGHSREAKRLFRRGFKTGNLMLGFSSQAALGDAMRYSLLKEEERFAQHGPVKIIMKDGKLVEPDKPDK